MTQPDVIQRFLHHLETSLSTDTFVGLQLTSPRSHNNRIQRVDVRRVLLKSGPRLSFTCQYRPTHSDARMAKPVTVKNRSPADGVARISAWVQTDFRTAFLRTTRGDWQMHRPEKGRTKIVRHKPSNTAVPSLDHDAAKRTHLGPAAAVWLNPLGITDPAGKPRPSMAHKYRQIDRYTEILHHLAEDCGWATRDDATSAPLRIADMGCGKGYLTFAVWHLFHSALHRSVSILGVEARPELAQAANNVARQINARGLTFAKGDIASVELQELDVLIALHACNTATDDAIRRGIAHKAKLIVVAPCCHQALRPELGSPAPFAPLLRHGLFKERLAEWLTDGLRALILEWAGYQTKVIEFVGSEHTPKNLMLAAIQKRAPFKDDGVRRRILDLKGFFNIRHHALDDLVHQSVSKVGDGDAVAAK